MERILIIDDEVQIRKLLRKMLERAGYEVEEASNGKVALKLYQHNPADLVITDILMPEKEGIETIRELRTNFPHVKIIAISGGGTISPENHLHIAKLLGVERTFSKPFDLKKMLEAIQEILA